MANLKALVVKFIGEGGSIFFGERYVKGVALLDGDSQVTAIYDIDGLDITQLNDLVLAEDQMNIADYLDIGTPDSGYDVTFNYTESAEFGDYSGTAAWQYEVNGADGSVPFPFTEEDLPNLCAATYIKPFGYEMSGLDGIQIWLGFDDGTRSGLIAEVSFAS